MPYMSTPTRKIFPDIQIIAIIQEYPVTIVVSTCQKGTGSVAVVTRRIMTNGIKGGMKLAMVASTPLGSFMIGNHSSKGIIRTSMAGAMSDWASRNSLTALPTPATLPLVLIAAAGLAVSRRRGKAPSAFA